VAGTPPWRLLDGSLISEPGSKTGSQWRIHYSLRWPSLECDYFKLTPVADWQSHAESARPRSKSRGEQVSAYGPSAWV
jgi:hypothetical protein